MSGGRIRTLSFHCLTALCLATALLSCGDDGNNGSSNNGITDDGGGNNGNDAGNDDGGDNNGTDGGGGDGGDNNGMPDGGDPDMSIMNPDLGCEEIEVIPAPIESQLIEDDLLENDFDRGTTSCAANISESDTTGVKIYKLSPEIETDIDIVIDGVPKLTGEVEIPPDPVVELRKAACNQRGEVVSCSADRNQEFTLEGGEDYYLVVNGKLDSGGIRIDMEAKQIICDVGTSMCTNGAIERCDGGTKIDTFECLNDTCLDDSVCVGDDCMNAVDISPTTGQPINLAGNRGAYTSSWDARDRDGCSLDDGPAGPTGGSEMIVRLNGLMAGDTVEIDAEQGEGSYGFYILEDCSAEVCLAADDFDTNNFNRMEWDVPADGSYILIVESLGMTARDFDIDVGLL